jgi:transposase-like protein
MAELIRVNFGTGKVVSKHLLDTPLRRNNPKWKCNSCGNTYEKDGDNSVKGIEFAKGFVVCYHCIEQAYDMLKGE